VFHLASELMPPHPAGHFLREALPRFIKLIGCNRLTRASYDDRGCLESAKAMGSDNKRQSERHDWR
jgi:hypothetical protein